MVLKLPTSDVKVASGSVRRSGARERSADILALAAAAGDRRALDELLRRLAPSVLRITHPSKRFCPR